MNAGEIVRTLLVIGGLGIFVGVFLGVAAIAFKVKTNEIEEKILAALPGNNCGGCGYPGCAGLAKAIANKEAPCNQCPVGGEAVGKVIAAITGEESEEKERMVAFVACRAHCEDATTDYNYYGVEDCRMLSFVPNQGPKSCDYGCLGFGSCASVCPFGAISVTDGVASVDHEKCKACGKCVEVCPKHLISLVPYKAKYRVACSNHDKGAVTVKECKVGCVGCGMCERNCPNEAVKVDNFNATINYDLCVNCGACAEKCPKKVIDKAFE